MNPEEARQRFVEEHQAFERAATSLSVFLQALCRSLHVPATVEAREKAVGSFVKKIYLNKLTRPWEEITDKVGARIIVGTLWDVRRVLSPSSASSA